MMIKKNNNQNIELLRGFSVLIVFLFHFNSSLFNSFFVGVDIFFLVSGYVITKSILSKKKFIFFDYLLRRIKRIYPNLIFILTIFFLSYFFFFKEFANDFNINFFSLISSIFGVSNFYYSLNPELFYFNKEIRWLMHTWSLSVEIQFYIFFGVIGLIYSIFFNKENYVKNIFLVFILVLAILSFTIFVLSDIKFISDYYSFLARFWEFVLGASIYFFSNKKKINFNKLFLIFFILLSFSNILALNYKLIIILSLVSIFFLIIFSKQHKNNFFTKPITYYGKISYSFYLWHLIIFSFSKYYFNSDTILFFSTFLLTTIFSHFSYNYIEVRFNKKFFNDDLIRKILKFIFFSLLIFIFYSLFINKDLLYKIHNNLNKQSIKFFKIIDNKNILNIENKDLKIILQRYDDCNEKYENFSWFTRVNCLKKNNNKNLVYLFGNSFSEHLIPALHDISNINLIHSRFENEYLIDDVKFDQKKLDKLIDQFNNISKKFTKKIIIISLNRSGYSNKKVQYFLNNINHNIKIIIVYPHPSMETLKNQKLLSLYQENKSKDFIKLRSYKKIIVFDSFKYLCNNCNHQEYSKLFDDESHYNINGSLVLKNPIQKLLFLNNF